MIAERYIVPVSDGPAQYVAGDFVQGYVGVNVDDLRMPTPQGELLPVAHLYDVIVGAGATPPATFYYHAEMQDDGTIVIKLDLFQPGAFKHTFAGWPVPGDPVEQPLPPETKVEGVSP
jgi:hypothetical protein